MIRMSLLLLALALSLAGCAHVRPAAPLSETRAMTFNIRLNTAADGVNAWPNRRELVVSLIRREAPHILGMQEVLPGQMADIERALPEYQIVGVGRDDGARGGEFSPLAWRTDRYDLVDWGTFWLSPMPEQPGKGWDAAFPRLATWAILRDRRSGDRLRVLNTHFDHVGQIARRESARMIAGWTTSSPASDLPTLVLGDFNAEPGSEPYALLANTEGSGLTDTRTASTTPPYGPPGTFNAFDILRNAPAPIDHVFVSPEWTVTSYAVLTQHWGGRLPSDHYPVLVTLEVADDSGKCEILNRSSASCE